MFDPMVSGIAFNRNRKEPAGRFATTMAFANVRHNCIEDEQAK